MKKYLSGTFLNRLKYLIVLQIIFSIFLIKGCSNGVKGDLEYHEDDNGILYIGYSGDPKSRQEYNGTFRNFYPDKQREFTVDYKDGLKHGKLVGWYKNGNIKIEEHYENGKRNGLSKFWYENGNQKDIALYKDGIIDGIVDTWYENGQKKQMLTYEDGVLVMEMKWEEDGTYLGVKKIK